MQTQTIPSSQWVEYFDHFSRDHAGWSTTIEVLDRSTGPQKLAKHLSLQGLSFDTNGTRPSSIEIGLGDAHSPHVAHLVDLPLYIREAKDAEGNIDLQIEPAVGPVTLLHLSAPLH